MKTALAIDIHAETAIVLQAVTAIASPVRYHVLLQLAIAANDRMRKLFNDPRSLPPAAAFPE
jgi:hypothetical protein